MQLHKDDVPEDREGAGLDIRLIGKFILWAVITSVGGIVLYVLSHDKAIAVIEQRLTTIEESIEDLEE